MDFINVYFNDLKKIMENINKESIQWTIERLALLRKKRGRLFILGTGGSAGNASHAVNDFRKIAHIEAYTPSDNVSELTARINDEGWDTCYSEWLKISNLNQQDAVLILSVGGGNKEYGVSMNIVKALDLAKQRYASIIGMVGRDGGETLKMADICIIIPEMSQNLTPLTEACQAIIWHLIVCHPKIIRETMKWESV
jgi:D-sedoheptulose 7-phosphate isomerase